MTDDSERRRAKRRSSMHASKHATDVVAAFTHHKIRDASAVAVQQHDVNGQRALLIKHHIGTDAGSKRESAVIEYGREVRAVDQGFDYAIAIVHKETGAVEFKPASYVQFEAQVVSDVDLALGRKQAAGADYSRECGFNKEDFSKRRAELTDNFGSSKKMKMQQMAQTRLINDTTLDQMQKTAFASASTVAKTDKDEVKKEHITLLNQAKSEILPEFTESAKPSEVYPLSVFFSEEECEEAEEEVAEFMKKNKKELAEMGFPQVVLDGSRGSKGDATRQYGYCLLGCMTFFYGLCGLRRSSLHANAITQIPFPEQITHKVRRDYFKGDMEKGRQGVAISINQSEKDRLMAHCFALALSLDDGCTLPITPWSKQLRLSEMKVCKLLEALGCQVMSLSAEEALRVGSVRSARLMGPPEQKKKFGAKKFGR